MPAEQVYVFDACAVLALLQGEEGSAVAGELLLEESHRCPLHAIHACEVYDDLFRRDGEEVAAERARQPAFAAPALRGGSLREP
ncbi:MAG: hypothetical protein U0002_13335 [Thermoanaerobaculia bacterium]